MTMPHTASLAGLPQPILVIDDDPFVRSVVVAALKAAGISDAQTCASGEEAIARLEGLTPGLVLMDCVLPGMSGPAAWKIMYERMTSAGATPRVIFLTARLAGDIQRDTPGACGVLSKPFNPLTLVERLRDIFGVSIAADDARASSQQKLDGVAAQFRGALPETAQAMDDAWRNVRAAGWHKPSAQALLEHAHKLAGTAGLFGFHKVGLAAEAVERQLLLSLKQDVSPTGDELNRLDDAVRGLTSACRTA